MTYDPMSEVIDEPLTIDDHVVQALKAFRAKEKLAQLPGVDPTVERRRLTTLLNDLTDGLLHGIETNPTKLWVMTQFRRHLVTVSQEDTEGREHFGTEIEVIMDILGIESSDGLLAFYLGGI